MKTLSLREIKNSWNLTNKKYLYNEISMLSGNLSVERPDVNWWGDLNVSVYFRIYENEFEYSFIEPDESEKYFELNPYIMAVLFNSYRMGILKNNLETK
jgi:hypothetical protein